MFSTSATALGIVWVAKTQKEDKHMKKNGRKELALPEPEVRHYHDQYGDDLFV